MIGYNVYVQSFESVVAPTAVSAVLRVDLRVPLLTAVLFTVTDS